MPQGLEQNEEIQVEQLVFDVTDAVEHIKAGHLPSQPSL